MPVQTTQQVEGPTETELSQGEPGVEYQGNPTREEIEAQIAELQEKERELKVLEKVYSYQKPAIDEAQQQVNVQLSNLQKAKAAVESLEETLKGYEQYKTTGIPEEMYQQYLETYASYRAAYQVYRQAYGRYEAVVDVYNINVKTSSYGALGQSYNAYLRQYYSTESMLKAYKPSAFTTPTGAAVNTLPPQTSFRVTTAGPPLADILKTAKTPEDISAKILELSSAPYTPEQMALGRARGADVLTGLVEGVAVVGVAFIAPEFAVIKAIGLTTTRLAAAAALNVGVSEVISRLTTGEDITPRMAFEQALLGETLYIGSTAFMAGIGKIAPELVAHFSGRTAIQALSSAGIGYVMSGGDVEIAAKSAGLSILLSLGGEYVLPIIGKGYTYLRENIGKPSDITQIGDDLYLMGQKQITVKPSDVSDLGDDVFGVMKTTEGWQSIKFTGETGGAGSDFPLKVTHGQQTTPMSRTLEKALEVSVAFPSEGQDIALPTLTLTKIATGGFVINIQVSQTGLLSTQIVKTTPLPTLSLAETKYELPFIVTLPKLWQKPKAPPGMGTEQQIPIEETEYQTQEYHLSELQRINLNQKERTVLKIGQFELPMMSKQVLGLSQSQLLPQINKTITKIFIPSISLLDFKHKQFHISITVPSLRQINLSLQKQGQPQRMGLFPAQKTKGKTKALTIEIPGIKFSKRTQSFNLAGWHKRRWPVRSIEKEVFGRKRGKRL